MTKHILAICLAATGFGGLLESNAAAREVAAPVQTQAVVAAALPNTVHLDATIVLEEGGHRRHYHHRRHYNHRRHYRHRYYRHGHYYYR